MNAPVLPYILVTELYDLIFGIFRNFFSSSKSFSMPASGIQTSSILSKLFENLSSALFELFRTLDGHMELIKCVIL